MIGLISKVVIFGIDLFVRNRARSDSLKANFEAFLKKFDRDSQKAGNLHNDYEDLKHDSMARVQKDKGTREGLDG
jgi:hypothetical protein